MFDFNADSRIDTGDLDTWVRNLKDTFFGDADLNGAVNFADFVILSDGVNQPGGRAQGYFNADGVVQFADFVVLSEHFGNVATPSAAAVPEPGSALLAVLSRRIALLAPRTIS